MPRIQPKLKFAQTQEEAHMRADLHEANDPFPSIPAALLSSAEISDYVRVTGMIHPFDEQYLKGASYEACARGAFIQWDEAKQKKVKYVDANFSYVTLPANSITFLQLQSKFRLPSYIGARFNLSISHVHRGLLLGTGPLVDPGFRGQLLIPLHNLTATPYQLRLDKALVCIEFTKTTFGVCPTEQEASQQRVFKSFPPTKRNLTPSDYLRRANGDEPIVGAMPDAIKDAKDQVKEAKGQVKEVNRKVDFITAAGVVTIVIGVIAAWLGGWQIVVGSLSLLTSAQHSNAPSSVVETKVKGDAGPSHTTSTSFSTQQSELNRMHAEIDSLKARLKVLESKADGAVRPGVPPHQ